jgi:hypothetical protein
MVAFGVPQEEETSDDSDDEGTEGGPLLRRVGDFVGSVVRLAWAKERGCSWDEDICVWEAARFGHLEVMMGMGAPLPMELAGVRKRCFEWAA